MNKVNNIARMIKIYEDDMEIIKSIIHKVNKVSMFLLVVSMFLYVYNQQIFTCFCLLLVAFSHLNCLLFTFTKKRNWPKS